MAAIESNNQQSQQSSSWLHRLCSSVLKCGPVPEHVAFIMDGNRRFALKANLKRIDGHSEGFSKLGQVLKWCQDLNVKHVTVYAFSLENFKRSDEEVAELMELARDKFTLILEQKNKLDEHGVRVRFIGDVQRLPTDLQEVVEKLERGTETNSTCFLNVCVAYTARYEMVESVRRMVKDLSCSGAGGDCARGNADNLLQMFEDGLQVPKVDLLIRTSGEVRLSDFLLWQSSFSLLSFFDSLWPELSVWQFYLSVLDYQRAYASKRNVEKLHAVR